MATIKEIADIVGVSRGTVDRVLNNRGGVKPETEARIRRVLESLNYTPNQAGKILASRRKNLKFGMIFRNDNPRYHITSFVRRKAQDFYAYGIETTLLEADISDPASYVKAFDQLKEAGVCGIIVMPVDDPLVTKKMKELQDDGIVIIQMDRHIEGTDCFASVESDFRKCGEVLGKMLGLLTGKNGKTALITFPEGRRLADQRIQAVLLKLARDYPGIKVVKTIHTEDDSFAGYRLTRQLLREHSDLDSVLINATSVTGVCRAIEESGQKLNVLCFDSVTLPEIRDLVERGVIHVIIDQRSQLQASIAMDLLFNYAVYGTLPPERQIYTNYEINIGGNLETEFS